MFIQQIEASPKEDIHERITIKIACINQITSSGGAHPSKETLRRVKQVYSDVSHNFLFSNESEDIYLYDLTLTFNSKI